MAKYALLFSYTSDAWARMINSPSDRAAAALDPQLGMSVALLACYLLTP